LTKDQAARASFFQDPEVFACNNLILPEVPGDQWNNGIIRIYQAAFIDYGLEFEFTCTRRGGEGQLGVYGVRQFLGQDTQGTFGAYWCPYRPNEVGAVTVWNEALTMFTADMTGCTLGVGSQAADGAVRVAHVNMQKYDKEEDKSSMRDAQRFYASRASGPNARILDPEEYRRGNPFDGDEVHSTTFGVRRGGVWRFYSQRWTGAFGEYQLLNLRAL
jgi:hypothetical protein